MAGFFQDKIRRILNVKSARGVSFALSIVSMASKPMGYVRILITAWAFGTSSGMDSFHLASGIVALFAGGVGSAMQNAVLPELERLRGSTGGEEACRPLYAVVAWIVIFVSSLMCAAFVVAPGGLVRVFARGFDAERIRMGAVMLWWLMPFAVATIFRPLLDIWAMFRERYTLSCVCAFFFNFVAIPVLLIASPLVGVYSVALSMSAGHAVSFALFFIGLHGIPLFLRGAPVPWGSVLTIAKNAFFSFVLTGMGALYMVIDRYFASRLPSGSVAAISYAGNVFSILSLAATTPMLFFLARTSKAVNSDPDLARRTVYEAMALIMAYFLPVGIFLCSCGRPVISIVYGWGSFGAESIDMTSTALSAYCIGLVFSLMAYLISSYAVAMQRLRTIVCFSVVGIVTNTTLNWLLVQRYGLFGLALATSVSQLLSFTIYFKIILRGSLLGFALRSRFFQQCLAVSILAWIAWNSRSFGSVPQISITTGLAVLYLPAAGRLGLMPLVPPHWQPLHLAKFFIASVMSYAGWGQK
jgi:putative peptidoglycan lipid II flippase